MKARLFLLALLLTTTAQAQTYRWVDKQGKVHYGDRPPAAAAGQVQERRLGAPAADKTLPYSVQQAMANFPVTLYVTADCNEGCKDGRDYLKARGIPFSEKSVATNEEIDALKSLVGGGEAVVPVLTVGSKNAKGWLQSDWQRLLDAAGYPTKAPAR
jgi:glutaredoxin